MLSQFASIGRNIVRNIQDLCVLELLISQVVSASSGPDELRQKFAQKNHKSHAYFAKLKNLVGLSSHLRHLVEQSECLFEEMVKDAPEAKVAKGEPGDATEFIRCVEKLIISSETVEKHLENIQRLNREFVDFEKQELKLKAIKQTLESLTAALKTSLLHKRPIMLSSDKETAQKIDQIITKLVALHQTVVKRFKEKNEVFVKNSEKWNEFNTDFNTLQKWLQDSSTKIKDLTETQSSDNQLKDILKGVSSIAENRLLLERINHNGQFILARSNETDSKYLNDKLSIINQEWKCLVELLNELKKKFGSNVEKENGQEEQKVCVQMDDYRIKLNEYEENLNKQFVFKNELSIELVILELKAKYCEIMGQKNSFQSKFDIESSNGANLMQKYDQIIEKYDTKREEIERFYKRFRQIKQNINELTTWMISNKSNGFFLTELSEEEIKVKIDKYDKIKSNFNDLKQSIGQKFKVDENMYKIIDDLDKIWKCVDLNKILNDKKRISGEQLEAKIEKLNLNAPVQNQDISDNELSVINLKDNNTSVSKLPLKEDESKHVTDSNSIDEELYNDLFDWLLWINHNLSTQIITVGDIDETQLSIQKFNSIIDEIEKKEEKLNCLSKSESIDIKNKTLSLVNEWNNSKIQVIEYRNKLEAILTESQLMDDIFDNFSKNFMNLETKVLKQCDISYGESTLQRQKIDHKSVIIDYEILTKLYDDLKEKYETLMEKFASEDLSKIEIKFSRIESRFRDISDRLKHRAENLDQTGKIVFEFEHKLEEFMKWLEKTQKDINYLEDYLNQSNDSNSALYEISQCDTILKSLEDLKNWCNQKFSDIETMRRKLQPEPNLILKLIEEINVFRSNLEFKKSVVENALNSARSFLKAKSYNDFSNDTESNDGSELDLEQSSSSSYLILCKKVVYLEKKWLNLNKYFVNFEQKIYSFYQNLLLLNKSFINVNQKLEENESLVENLSSNLDHDEISDENQLTENLEKVKIFQISVTSLQPIIEEMNKNFANLSQDIQYFSQTVDLNVDSIHHIQNKYDDLNLRWTSLQQHIQEIFLNLYSLAETPESNIFFKLSASVQPPWQRSISKNKIPYYINHSTEITTWDHPKMIELFKSFANLNDIRFSAYRTAMKLRNLQKRLWLDYVDLSNALAVFDNFGHKLQNDKSLDANQIVQCLNQIFQSSVKSNESQMIDVVLAVDLSLNWLLSVYDPSRFGQIKSISLKIAFILLSNGSLEDKYIYLFNLMADEKGMCSAKKLGALLYDMIMIPKQLGEVAAFGGSNVDPSVKSCFEYTKAKEFINLDQFLNWVKLEPQSIVWLPVLHRLSVAESARHEAKCSICKEYPIIGFRYRSLKHFNFDICQNCFFSGRKVKGFKFDHPLLEYYSPTSSSDDIKDFFKIFKNKFKPKRGRRSSKLGYLPVQSLLEREQSLNFDSEKTDVEEKTPKTKENKLSIDIDKLKINQNELELVPIVKEIKNDKIESHEDNSKRNLHISFENDKSEDEHALIAKICSTLYNETIKNNEKITIEETYQQMELENMIKDLEEENIILVDEYNKLKDQLKSQIKEEKEPNQERSFYMKSMSNLQTHDSLRDMYDSVSRYRTYNTNLLNRRTFSHYTEFNDFLNMTCDISRDRLSMDKDVFLDTSIIRQQDSKLEARMKILENHNRLLDAQLKNLKNLLVRSRLKSSQYQSNEATVDRLHMTPTRNRNSLKETRFESVRKSANRTSVNNISTLFLNVEDITKAINNLNNLVNAMGVLDNN
ncbi:isoform B isoform X1 [Brachionus plicatilis]|uniref:Isoform B isoform X1 n=1 Tax=Brachionus plicatilis TaxID=10195 RepID=A0A3M7RLW5_BRAPC|nr:isoform B isoform X1 [Brachionus plicatilis]